MFASRHHHTAATIYHSVPLHLLFDRWNKLFHSPAQATSQSTRRYALRHQCVTATLSRCIPTPHCQPAVRRPGKLCVHSMDSEYRVDTIRCGGDRDLRDRVLAFCGSCDHGYQDSLYRISKRGAGTLRFVSMNSDFKSRPNDLALQIPGRSPGPEASFAHPNPSPNPTNLAAIPVRRHNPQ